jgi:hypothetical protein
MPTLSQNGPAVNVDPWDREYDDPADFPADCDDDRWVPTEYEPTPADLADLEAWLDSDPTAPDPSRDDARAELAFLLGQRVHCINLPRTLMLLDACIADARRRAGLEGVPTPDDEAWEWSVSARDDAYAAAGTHDGPVNDLDHLTVFGHV